ncbi:MAG: SUMF1/EgtB/PvdO family nonheme iron enzyme [Fibrobacter sp.]|nr:SUMF1/EgtB/PvdO family nonheme iron enzyme [Fibrobacter sp.]
MHFLRILPILVLLPVLALADSDKMFRVSMEQYKVGDLFEPFPEMAIKVPNSAATIAPVLPLKENMLFLRHKKTPKEYHWVQGKVNPAAFSKLHAFSLEKNQLTVFDVIRMRLYPTKNSKAFQDETDIYFDREYIYSPRVPKLFFMKNGRWQLLKEDPLPGIVKVESSIKDLKISSLDTRLRNASKTISPVAPGPYSFVFSADGYMPFADIGVVQSGKTLLFKPNLVLLQPTSLAQSPLSVTVEQVVATPNLEYTEVLYDKYVGELISALSAVDTNDFARVYPAKKQAVSVGLEMSDPTYQAYSTRYDVVHTEALDLWRKSKMPGVSVLDQAFKQKFDSLHALPARFYLVPDSIFYDTVPDSAGTSEMILVAPVPAPSPAPVDSAAPVDSTAPADSSAPVDSVAGVVAQNSSSLSVAAPVATVQQKPNANFLILKFSQPVNRYDVTWKGQVPGYASDSLAAMLASPDGSARIIVSLQNNKPVWIYGMEGGVTRHHYRYVKLEVQVADQIIEAQGSFILPQYIFEQQEVQDWLNPPPPAPVESSSSFVPEQVSSSSVESSSSQVEPRKNIVNDPLRGQLAIVDSGSFRYYGNVVEMSPFAIMTTEMTQELMEKAMLRIDSAARIKDKSTFFHPQKPVHNINWDDARKVCQVNGGDLPTEAQWEFAGRAGGIEGAPWVLDSIPDPSVYAVYIENSYKMRKEDEAYGPQQVATKKPNAWGIYDMSGNVAEWTRDKYFMLSFYVESSNPTGALFGSSRVYKGGSWKDKEKMLNMSVRDDEDPRYWSETLGFRCVYPLDVIGK